MAMAATPPATQPALSSAALINIRSSLKAGIDAAKSDHALIRAALAQAVQAAIATYGAGYAGTIASAIISDAEALGVQYDDIGAGLAEAATALAGTNAAAAQAIALTVANEGNQDEIKYFMQIATSLGYKILADIAGGTPTPTGETTAGGVGLGSLSNGFSGGFPGGGTPGGNGCLNPSCTSL